MTTTSPQEGRPTRRSAYAEKAWTMHLRVAIHMPATGWPFVQLPPGDYGLYEHADVGYELRMSDEFCCYFRLADLEAMRSAGDLTIDGTWPE